MAKSLEEINAMPVHQLVDEYRKLEQTNALYNTLANDPETRSELLRLAKKKHPNTPIPEIDAQLATERIVAAEAAERAKTDEKVAALEARERWREQRAATREKYDLTDADLLQVEALMVDKDAPIPHYDAAVKVFRASQRQAEPSSASLQDRTLDMPDKNKWGKGVGNPVELTKIMQREMYAAINEARGLGKTA